MQMTRQIDIKGYDGRYYITDQGEVFRRYKNHDRKLTPYIHKRRKSLNIGLVDSYGKKKIYTMNRLMKIHFFNCKSPKYGLWHKNGMQTDCSLQNLQLMDIHTISRLAGAKAKRKTVLELCVNSGDIINIYPSARQAAKERYVSHQTMADWCNGKHNNSLFPDIKFMWDEDYAY